MTNSHRADDDWRTSPCLTIVRNWTLSSSFCPTNGEPDQLDPEQSNIGRELRRDTNDRISSRLSTSLIGIVVDEACDRYWW